MASKKVKVVLSGSGTRYPCFIGALWRLLADGYEVTEICGTSGGAIVAAKFATSYDKDDPRKTMQSLLETATSTLPGPLLDLNWFETAFSFRPQNLFRKDRKVLSLNTKGIFKGKKILKALQKELPSSFEETVIPMRIVTFNNNMGEHKIWTAADGISLPHAVRASMSLPIIFDPVKLGGDIHTDGGITANFPLDVFGNGEDVVGFRFGSSGPTRRNIKSKLDIAAANIDGAIESAMREDIKDASLRSRICYLHTRQGGLNLHMTKEDVGKQINEGWDSVDSWLKEQS